METCSSQVSPALNARLQQNWCIDREIVTRYGGHYARDWSSGKPRESFLFIHSHRDSFFNFLTLSLTVPSQVPHPLVGSRQSGHESFAQTPCTKPRWSALGRASTSPFSRILCFVGRLSVERPRAHFPVFFASLVGSRQSVHEPIFPFPVVSRWSALVRASANVSFRLSCDVRELGYSILDRVVYLTYTLWFRQLDFHRGAAQFVQTYRSASWTFSEELPSLSRLIILSARLPVTTHLVCPVKQPVSLIPLYHHNYTFVRPYWPVSRTLTCSTNQQHSAQAEALHRIRTNQAVKDAAAAAAVDTFPEDSDQHHQPRPRLSDFMPPSNPRKFSFRPYDPWPRSPVSETPTPPGTPEPEEDNFIPNLSDCEIFDEVGPSSEDETSSPVQVPPSPPPRLVRIRNTKTNETRFVGLSQLFRPSSQDRIVRHKLN
ncbi:hypothetical protein OUZ56_010615 [Daphnia magna]|uniref:Uncharacterized protein n=1 Tax=Daphnia magna TaxID=35525 RepID=A0ABR0AJ21_9CRUS|nr:hypothetical protein OUZ56_010615 [Daphnia magna]